MEELLVRARTVLANLPQFCAHKVLSSENLAGDASARCYVRLNLSAGTPSSVILMILAAGSGPIAAGDTALSQSDSFVLLNHELREASLPVPQIYYDGRTEGFLLIEDIGDLQLWRIALQELTPQQAELVRHTFSADPVERSFRCAIDLLGRLRSLPAECAAVAGRRHLSFEQYRIEAQRFIDLCLLPRAYTPAKLGAVESMLNDLCRSIDAHPRVPCYRDFMAWNIMLDTSGQLRLLDYQDMLSASQAYDAASLLNDRDTDQALGARRWLSLLQYARATLGAQADFERQFLECSLQRDLRLAGQFWNLSRLRGKLQYEKWVPGCLRRIGRVMAELGRWPELLKDLSEFSPEIKAGASAPWLFSR